MSSALTAYQGIVKSVAAEAWTGAWAFGAAVMGAVLALLSAKSLKREDVVSANLRAQLEHWEGMAGRLQAQVEYRDRQLAQYQVIVEKINEDRRIERRRLDECERGRIDLYRQINELRGRLNLEPVPIPRIDHPHLALPPSRDEPTC